MVGLGFVGGVLPKDAFPLPRAAEGVLKIVAERAHVAEDDAGGEDGKVFRPAAIRWADGPKQQPQNGGAGMAVRGDEGYALREAERVVEVEEVRTARFEVRVAEGQVYVAASKGHREVRG